MNTKQLAAHTEQTVMRFLDAAGSLERRLDGALSISKGISFSEYRLLSAVAEAAPRGCTRISLAKRLGLSASAVTRALKPLEKTGFVETARNERDARQSLAMISGAGQGHLQEARSIVQDVLASLALNDLSARKVDDFCSRLDEIAPR